MLNSRDHQSVLLQSTHKAGLTQFVTCASGGSRSWWRVPGCSIGTRGAIPVPTAGRSPCGCLGERLKEQLSIGHAHVAGEVMNVYGKIQALPVKLHPGMYHLPCASWISELPLPTPGSGVCPAPLVLQQSSSAWSVVRSFGGRNSSLQLNHAAGTVLVPRNF